jgi:hypothetical protein
MIDHLWVGVDVGPQFKVFAEDVEYLENKTVREWVESFPRFLDLPNELPNMRKERWQREYTKLAAQQRTWIINVSCHIYIMALKGQSIRERQFLITGAFTELSEQLIAMRQLYKLQAATHRHPSRGNDVLEMTVQYSVAGVLSNHTVFISPLKPSDQVK